MDRLTILMICLGLGNLFLWSFSNFEEIIEKPQWFRDEIKILEKDITELEKLSTWAQQAQASLNQPPSENATNLMNRIQALAKVWNFTLQETAQTGENPVHITIAGIGAYKTVASLLTELTRSPAVIINKITLLIQDDLLLNTHLELEVRNGPWEGTATGKGYVEPLKDTQPVITLGKVDLFGHPEAPAPVVVGKPNIRFLGFYSGKGKPTGIIEENLKTMLAQPGDRTPSGLIIKAIAPEYLEIGAGNERGTPWKIPLENSH
ncbi:MAG: hypothetical protein HQM09_24195 [Candidatus Riflebacteria bacterium]|nr:hypothetical protein [Candidatus Riflebacteria bacterium]